MDQCILPSAGVYDDDSDGFTIRQSSKKRWKNWMLLTAIKVTEPKDAYIDETSSGFEIVEEVEGNQLDEDKVYELLCRRQ